jgi:hypothetical protein
MGRIWTASRRIAHGISWACVAAAILFGYGLGSDDARVLGEFSAAVERWQAGPEFRRVADEYVRLSHAAMNASPWEVRATTWIMAIRAIPGLPPEYAVSPTSQLHYDNFTRGELSAYLHLCGEQTMGWVIRDLHGVATRGSSDADVEGFLRSWKMNRAVAADAAAVAGVKRLLAEIDAVRPMEVRAQIQADLEAAAVAVASRLGYARDLRRLTSGQQHEVYERLDADVREHNRELWRLKQMSDLCSGIWAQTFGGDYTMVIDPVMSTRRVARVAGPVAGALGLCVILWKRRRARTATISGQPHLAPADNSPIV